MRAMESLFQMIKKGWNSQFLLTDASLLMQQQSQHPQDLQQQVLGYKIPPEHCLATFLIVGKALQTPFTCQRQVKTLTR